MSARRQRERSCYTISPVHTIEEFVSKRPGNLKTRVWTQIAIKDMAGLIDPWTTFESVSNLKKAVDYPIYLHTHDNCGLVRCWP